MFQNTRLCLQKPGKRTASKKIRGLKNKGTKMTCFRQWILVIISISNNWTPKKGFKTQCTCTRSIFEHYPHECFYLASDALFFCYIWFSSTNCGSLKNIFNFQVIIISNMMSFSVGNLSKHRVFISDCHLASQILMNLYIYRHSHRKICIKHKEPHYISVINISFVTFWFALRTDMWWCVSVKRTCDSFA